MKWTIIVALQLAVLAGISGLGFAQTTGSQTGTDVTVEAKPLNASDIALLGQDIQSMKMDLITKAMRFSDAEASGFWPVYKEYANEQYRIGDAKYRIIKDYAEGYDQMTDAKASDLSDRMFRLDNAVYETRTKFWPRFEKVLGAKRAAKFYQVDRRLSLMIDLELASEIPVLQ